MPSSHHPVLDLLSKAYCSHPLHISSTDEKPIHVSSPCYPSCLLSCVTDTQQGPKKPSHSPKTAIEKGKLEAPSCFSVPPLHAQGEWMSPGATLAEAQASPANSMQAPGGVRIEMAVERSKPAGERTKEGQVTVFTPAHSWRTEDLSLTSHPTSGTHPALQRSRTGCSPQDAFPQQS